MSCAESSGGREAATSRVRRAANAPMPSAATPASTVQSSLGSNATISASRAQMRRSETDCSAPPSGRREPSARNVGVRCGGSHTRRGQVSSGPNPSGACVSLITGIAAWRRPSVPGEHRRTASSRMSCSSSHTRRWGVRGRPGGPKDEASLAAQARPGR